VQVGFSNAFRGPARFWADGAITTLHLLCLSRLRCCNGLFDECLKHLRVHIRELLDVQASLACGVLAKLGEQRLSAIKAYRAVQNICGLARKKPTMGISPSRPLS